MSTGQERGSLAIEYVIVAPIFLIVFGLIFAFARTSQLDGLLDSGARDAARAVSISPDLSPDGVQKVARDSIDSELGDGLGGCSKNNVVIQVVGYNVDTNLADQGELHPGDIAKITVTCQYSLSDLGLPIPGLSGLTTSSVFASIIDPNRSA